MKAADRVLKQHVPYYGQMKKGVTSITQRKENETQEEKGIQADQLEPERQQSSVTGGGKREPGGQKAICL